jgi:hypothetical protein
LRARRRANAANGTGITPHMIDKASANAALGSPRATPHLPPLPQPLLLLELLLELSQLPQLPPLLLLLQLSQPPPEEPPLDELDELQLLQPPPDDPPEEDDDEQPPPPPPLLDDELDEHESQLAPLQPLELFELAHVESQDSELLQLGPEQLQFGEASQFLSLLHESPQLTFVDRGGSVLAVPASTPGPGNDPVGVP